MLIYATSADLAAAPWQSTPDNAGVLLRAASTKVRAATIAAVYDTDSDGYPTNPGYREAMRDATCAQAAHWAAAHIDPTAAGADPHTPTPVSKSIGGASIAYTVESAAAQQARAAAATRLCAEAVDILRGVGLLDGQPR